MLRPEHLEGYSADEIDDRLIPFKKRNFKELQEKESMIKVIIDRITRSWSSNLLNIWIHLLSDSYDRFFFMVVILDISLDS